MKFKETTIAGLAVIALAASTHGAILRVKPGGSSSGPGTNWGNAYGNPNDALAAAFSGDQIWIAAGTYKPGTTQASTFLLKQGVKLYGGFEGVSSETALSHRNPLARLTILSGDIDNDSVLDADNAHHVVRCDNTVTDITDATQLDGFVITMGWADNGTAFNIREDSGGGMLILLTSPVIQNCVFIKNRAEASGGGVQIMGHDESAEDYPEPIFRACRFIGNEARDSGTGNSTGGGMGFTNATVQLVNCVFSGNNAHASGSHGNGGGLFIGGHAAAVESIANITNCTFGNNTATSTTASPSTKRHSIYNGDKMILENSICWNTTTLTGDQITASIVNREHTIDDCNVQGRHRHAQQRSAVRAHQWHGHNREHHR